MKVVMQWARIEDYALLGDLQAAALVGRDGSVDWLCLPRFDSPACFAALLGGEDAGRWRLAPAGASRAARRSYRGPTLVLDTEWVTGDGHVRVTEFMPPRGEAPDLVRIVEGLSGRVPMELELKLRFDYGSITPWVQRRDDGLTAVAGPDFVRLATPVELHGHHMMTEARFEVSAGQKVPFVLTHSGAHRDEPKDVSAEQALTDTMQFWTTWIQGCRYHGRWQNAVHRALITLKALTFAPTGGIAAAATTSLPEQPRGKRNWDYRYCWLRDATFTLQALLGTGFLGEAREWREWLVRAVAGDPSKLQIVYALDGARRIPEQTLDWLSGYEGATPVRIGNDAATQFQLDVWGEVINGLHAARAAGLPGSDSAWDLQKGLLDFLEGNWEQPDSGLWEFRGSRRHFVHSKVMAWAGVDRAIKTAQDYRLDAPVDRWDALRTRIHRDVCERGFDAERGTFTQFYGSRGLDAALLLLPKVGFLPWTDPRIVGTIDAVRAELSDHGFVHRYQPGADGDVDGLSGTEGAFLACSFWLVDALCGIGRTAEAEALFEGLLQVRNDVGLLSEQYDTRTGRQMGNVPQAFSMVGLVNSALQLSAGPAQSKKTDLFAYK